MNIFSSYYIYGFNNSKLYCTKFLAKQIILSFDKRLSLYQRAISSIRQYFVSCIVCIGRRQPPFTVVPRYAAASVWSVGFNFVNQDASRSNELREAKGERHSLPNRRTCIRAKSHETQRKRTKISHREGTAMHVYDISFLWKLIYIK